MTSAPTPSATKRPTRLRRRLALALFSGAATVLLLEGALRLLHPLPAPPEKRLHRFLPSWEVSGPPRTVFVDPGPLPGVTPGLVENAWNRLGFLYPDDRHRRTSAGEVRIAAVGGSTTECCVLAADKRWTEVLETLLQARLGRPVTVLNLGVSARDTRTYLATTSHVVTDLDVDVCIYLIGTNDIGIATGVDQPMLGELYPQPTLSRVVRDLWQHSQIALHLDALRGEARALRTTAYYAADAAFQASLPVCERDAETTPAGLANYARNLVSLAGTCKEHGIRPLFATQPTLLSANPTPDQLRAHWGCHSGGYRTSAANFVALLASVNEHLIATCRDRGYAYADVASAVPKGFANFYDHVHFNEAGARRVAEALLEPVCALLR